MTNAIIISVCVMLLMAYLCEISAERTKIPSVLILLFLGLIVRQVTGFFHVNIPQLNPVLPFLGTIGLILIVLEGSLELKVDRSKTRVLKNSFLMALLPMLFLSLLFGMAFSYAAGLSLMTGLMNALPFCVISSSIAIPAARYISPDQREFVIYESSFSDIIGVLFFNFVLINAFFSVSSIGLFFLQVILITLISFFSVITLSYLLSRIKNHITFTPIILLVILIYAVAKEFDLSGLLFILIFGLFLGNISEIRRFYLIEMLVEKMNYEKLGSEITKFKAITIEATFIVKSLFFLLFGFLMETSEFFNLQTLPWAVGIVVSVIGTRWIFLRIFKLRVSPLLYFSPRGLISILLFLSILPGQNIPFVNDALMVQVIIISVVIMMIGLIKQGPGNRAPSGA